jgi:hypothetical protein
MEIFAPDTMRTVMSALMVRDLHNPPTDWHPERRIAHGGVHGGYWPAAPRDPLYADVHGGPRAAERLRTRAADPVTGEPRCPQAALQLGITDRARSEVE